jgi:hypothetical protein
MHHRAPLAMVTRVINNGELSITFVSGGFNRL